MRALLIIDVQNDFCDLGALAVPGANQIIPGINYCMDYFDCIIATKDWHPADHISFAANHPWRKPGQVIDVEDGKQELWVMHCVQGSFGAELSPMLKQEKISAYIHKGTERHIDSYSAFFDNGSRHDTGLHTMLQEKGIEEVYICGLATDFCVKSTALHAQELQYKTTVLIDLCKGINAEEGAVDKAIEELKSKGVLIADSNSIA